MDYVQIQLIPTPILAVTRKQHFPIIYDDFGGGFALSGLILQTPFPQFITDDIGTGNFALSGLLLQAPVNQSISDSAVAAFALSGATNTSPGVYSQSISDSENGNFALSGAVKYNPLPESVSDSYSGNFGLTGA